MRLRRRAGEDLEANAEWFGCDRGEIDQAAWALLGATPEKAAAELNARPSAPPVEPEPEAPVVQKPAPVEASPLAKPSRPAAMRRPVASLIRRPRNATDRDWIEELEARLAALRDQLALAEGRDVACEMSVSLGLTAQEARFLAVLWRRSPMVTSNAVVLNAISDLEDPDGGPDPKLVAVVVCKVRGKMPTLAGCIETVWGQGFRLTPEGRRRLDAILGLPS